MTDTVKTAFNEEMTLGHSARKAGEFDIAMHHYERAHIIG